MRRTSGRDGGIRTFLIADIRGYTRFTDQHGDEAASRLASVFAQIVAEAMEAWGGQLVELRGDEALCTFESPRASLRSALELQQTFAAEAALAPDLPLTVGIGLDLGEAVPVGDGFRGAALNIAARLCAGAVAGEIRATENLAHVAGPMPGIDYEPQGTERLKGVAADVAVVRVSRGADADGKSESRPDVRPMAGRSPEPLPAELESVVPLVGRAGDLLWLRWYWRRARLGHGNVVEITGQDGIGKTRLISELARLAHAEGAIVRYATDVTPDSEPSGAGHPAVLVVDGTDRMPSRVTDAIEDLEPRLDGVPVLVVLTRSTEAAAASGHRPRRRLGPLAEADVAEVAALYTTGSLEPPVRALLEESGGVPRAVHRLASQWARTAAAQQMTESARRTSRERRGLRAAEEELMGGYAVFEIARERTRLYGSGEDLVDESTRRAGLAVCPYKGLAAYEATDADYFFGREQLLGELVARVVGSSFVGLFGASGSGKSSVLTAGLLPALADGVLPGSDQWIQVLMRPGTRPMRQLADALRRRQPGLAEEADAEVLLGRILDQMAPAQRLLVVIDQFEEVFTADEEERDRFIELIAEGRPAMKVVLAVRADQYERCAAYPRLARQLAADQVLVGPLRSEEVAAIVRHPAERVGLRVEPELVEALIADLGTEPGAMPLLSTALLELWEAREAGTLTLTAYRATGGVKGAVARLAESAYARLDPVEQEATRSLFLRLVGEGSEPETIVRRRLSAPEIETMGDPHIGEVVEKLTAGRLLTRDEGTVEVAHEALIREWPRLREWIEADATGREIRLHLIAAARVWDSGDREEGDLYRGARLATALEWAADRQSELTSTEEEFLRASRTSSEYAADRQRHTNRILRGLLAGAGVLLIAAMGAGAIAWVQARQNAENAATAQVRELSLSALALSAEDPELALLLAIEAVRLGRETGSTPPQALHALWSAYVAGKSVTAIPGVGSKAVAYSPDGSLLAIDAPELPDALVTLRDPSTGELVGSISEPDTSGPVEGIAYSPDGRVIAVATSGPPGAGAGALFLYDSSSRDRIQHLSSGHDGYRDVSFDGSGLVAAAGTMANQRPVDLVVWNMATGSERAVISWAPQSDTTDIPSSNTYSGALAPGTGQLILGFVFGTETVGGLMAIDLPNEFLRCPPCPDTRPSWLRVIASTPDVIAPSPVGNRIAIGDVGRGRIAVIDPLNGMPIFDPVPYQNPRAITWSSDRTLMTVSGSESGVAVVDAAEGRSRATLPSRGEVIPAASFRNGSDNIAVVLSTGELRIHTTTPTGGDISTSGRRPVDLAVTDAHVILSFDAVGIGVFERDSAAEVHGRDMVINANWHGQVAKDVGNVAGSHQNGSSVVIEAATLRETGRLPGCTGPTGASSDGRYVVVDAGSGVSGITCRDADVRGGVFDVSTSEMAIEYPSGRLTHGAVSTPDSSGTRFAALTVYEGLSGAGRVDIWEVGAQRPLATIGPTVRPGFLPAYLSFSHDARYLAVGTNGPDALVMDVAALADGAPIEQAVMFDREVHASSAPRAIITDRGQLATSSAEGTYRFWDLDSAEMTMELRVTGLIGTGAFDFSPDFQSFYYEDGGGIIRHMPVDTDEMIELATSSVDRTLTDDECRTYLHTDGCVSRTSR